MNAGERRTISIMFADISGFTAMSEDLDPELVRDLMNDCFDNIVPIITQYGGTIDKFMGDGIMALFGAPVSHEDDAERAIHAAIGMRDALKLYSAEKQIDLGIHFGINTGLVVTGAVGARNHQSYSVMGDAVNFASRLEHLSERGEILVGETTQRLTKDTFAFDALDSVKIKGKKKTGTIYRIEGINEERNEIIRSDDIPFVGRRKELQLLQAKATRLVEAGDGGIITVVGRSGLGKSRLVYELRKLFPPDVGNQKTEFRWVEVKCQSHGGGIAFHFWRLVLLALIGADAYGGVPDELLENYIGRIAPERSERLLPHLRRLLFDDRKRRQDPLQSLTADNLRLNIYKSVETTIESASKSCPHVLVCEDMQWADKSSLELLEHAFPVFIDAPLLLIFLYRPSRNSDFQGVERTAEKIAKKRFTQIQLKALPSKECKNIMQSVLSEDTDKSLSELILNHAEGNPFFLREILHSLKRDEDFAGKLHRGELQDIPLTDSIRSVLISNIDRLNADAKKTLQISSVIGREFDALLVQSIMKGDTDVNAVLADLVGEEVLEQRETKSGQQYTFRHHLLQDAAYQTLLNRERRALHERVALSYEKTNRGNIDEVAELLLYHWEKTDNDDKVIDYAHRAGTRAQALGASWEAISHYRIGLSRAETQGKEGEMLSAQFHEALGDIFFENLSHHDDSLEHYGISYAADTSHEYHARISRKIGDVLTLKGELDNAIERYNAGIALLAENSRDIEFSMIYAKLAYAYVLQGHYARAYSCAEKGLQAAKKNMHRRGLADAYRIMGIIAFYQGDQQAACRYCEQSIRIYSKLNDFPRLVQAYNNAANSYRLIGEVEKAIQYLHKGLDIARSIGDTRDEALVLFTIGEIDLDLGEWDGAVRNFEKAVAPTMESEVAIRKIQLHRLLGVAYEAVENLEESEKHLEAARELCTEAGHGRFMPEIYLSLSHLSITKSRTKAAIHYLEQAREAAGAEPSKAYLGLSHQCHGYLHYSQSRWSDAIAQYEESVKYLLQTELLAEAGKSCIALSDAYTHRSEDGDREKSLEDLKKAKDLFSKVGSWYFTAKVDSMIADIHCGVGEGVH